MKKMKQFKTKQFMKNKYDRHEPTTTTNFGL